MINDINFEQYAAYSKPGPRYTSYPTAIEFSEDFTAKDYEEALKISNERGAPLSIYIHLPFCRAACYFCGCSVVYTSKDDKKRKYIDYLIKEVELLKAKIDTKRVVWQLHLGGGTPTFFSADELSEIIMLVKNAFPNFSEDAEISCEIDPRFLNEEQMAAMRKCGLNRVSFGAQDFDEKVQAAVHRYQSKEETAHSVELARKYGVESINIDLIYGLPFQSLESFATTLEHTIGLNPDRLAVFNYAHVPWMKKTMRKMDETTLPEPNEKLKIFKYTIETLSKAGYEMIGMDHFAKPTDELYIATQKNELHRNFQGYATKGGADLIGIGLTSIFELPTAYVQNHKEMHLYEECIDAGKLPLHRGIKLTDDDLLRKDVIMSLMCDFELDFRVVEQKYGINFKDFFDDALEKLKIYEDGHLIEIADDKIKISPTGRLLIRNIAMAFDAHMTKYEGVQNRFSKTI
ncbi:MAG: oxygen-independent coproporphyrinogen oxidase [Pseudomonadota bacterium]|jgi:oxygen-independent coproporphyrinogen-3 oxidase